MTPESEDNSGDPISSLLAGLAGNQPDQELGGDAATLEDVPKKPMLFGPSSVSTDDPFLFGPPQRASAPQEPSANPAPPAAQRKELSAPPGRGRLGAASGKGTGQPLEPPPPLGTNPQAPLSSPNAPARPALGPQSKPLEPPPPLQPSAQATPGPEKTLPLPASRPQASPHGAGQKPLQPPPPLDAAKKPLSPSSPSSVPPLSSTRKPLSAPAPGGARRPLRPSGRPLEPPPPLDSVIPSSQSPPPLGRPRMPLEPPPPLDAAKRQMQPAPPPEPPVAQPPQKPAASPPGRPLSPPPAASPPGRPLSPPPPAASSQAPLAPPPQDSFFAAETEEFEPGWLGGQGDLFGRSQPNLGSQPSSQTPRPQAPGRPSGQPSAARSQPAPPTPPTPPTRPAEDASSPSQSGGFWDSGGQSGSSSSSGSSGSSPSFPSGGDLWGKQEQEESAPAWPAPDTSSQSPFSASQSPPRPAAEPQALGGLSQGPSTQEPARHQPAARGEETSAPEPAPRKEPSIDPEQLRTDLKSVRQAYEQLKKIGPDITALLVWEGESLSLRHLKGASPADVPAIRPAWDHVRNNLKPSLIDDTRRQSVYDDCRNTFRSGVCVPLVRDDFVLAVLFIGSHQPGAFDSRTVRLVQKIAEKLGSTFTLGGPDPDEDGGKKKGGIWQRLFGKNS